MSVTTEGRMSAHDQEPAENTVEPVAMPTEERLPWVAPVLEELDLRQTMAPGAVVIFDGAAGSS